MDIEPIDTCGFNGDTSRIWLQDVNPDCTPRVTAENSDQLSLELVPPS